ncbi:proline--tRNA ligase [Candidatus Uhrbacteria bacterium]|nr:proline--tRNA ligase [Candidatus Uhrbacteria bacterium]
MKYSELFAKPSKTAPHDADSANAKFLAQAGFIHQEMAGVYSWLPLGLKVLKKVEAIIREELNEIGAQEILMPALQPKDNWENTGRWDAMDVLFKLQSQTDRQYALGSTHEEIVTPLVGSFINSYKDLPVAVYQIQSKYRDELRAKSGILRGREFGMKDLYSFHATQEDLEQYYEKVKQTYLRIFKRCGLDAKVVESSGGDFTKKYSHEFQVITPAGEDDILACPNCTFAQNIEIATMKAGEACPSCGNSLESVKGIEIGNIFDLNDKFTTAFGIKYTDEYGEQKIPIMGCYGIGTTRLVGAIVEAHHDDKGMIWPDEVAPANVHLVTLNSKDEAVNEKVLATAQGLRDTWEKAGKEVFWDDRTNASAGEKLGDADLMGLSFRVVVSPKTLEQNGVEVKRRDEDEAKIVGLDEIVM